MRELIGDIEACCLLNARQRVVGYLLQQAEKDPSNLDRVTLPGPKAMVASLLNLSAETFSRELHALEHAGLLEIDRRRLRLRDRAALLALLGQLAESAQRD
jgi:CRP-like cAMP-binding protein